MAGWVLICLSLCMSNFATVSLTDDERAALEMLCRRRKVEALVWKRARAFILLDAGYDPKIVCEILDIGPSVLMEWRFAYKADCAFWRIRPPILTHPPTPLVCCEAFGFCYHFRASWSLIFAVVFRMDSPSSSSR